MHRPLAQLSSAFMAAIASPNFTLNGIPVARPQWEKAAKKQMREARAAAPLKNTQTRESARRRKQAAVIEFRTKLPRKWGQTRQERMALIHDFRLSFAA